MRTLAAIAEAVWGIDLPLDYITVCAVRYRAVAMAYSITRGAVFQLRDQFFRNRRCK